MATNTIRSIKGWLKEMAKVDFDFGPPPPEEQKNGKYVAHQSNNPLEFHVYETVDAKLKAEARWQVQALEEYERGKPLWTSDDLLTMLHGVDKTIADVPTFIGPMLTHMKKHNMHRYVKFHGFHELTGAPFLGVHAPFSFAPSTFSGMDTDSIPMNLSIPYADDYFRRELENWNDTHPLAYALRKMIRKANIDPNVNKVICFGLGDPCRAPGENNPKYHAVWRHIVAWIIAEELAKKNNMFIELISQEPGYSHVAQQFLPRAGFIIHIDGITAVPMVDRKTVVFAPCAKFPIKEVIADVAKPAAMFWPTIKSREITEFEMNALPLRKLKHTGGIKVVSDHPCPDTPRTRAMIDEYQEFLFPKTDLMGEMTLYVFDRDLAEEPTGPRVVDPEISSTQQDTGPKFLTELSIQAIDDDAPCGLSHEQPSPAA